MKIIKSIKENFRNYLISLGILVFSISITHFIRNENKLLDILTIKIGLATLILFGLMVMMLFLLGDKE